MTTPARCSITFAVACLFGLPACSEKQVATGSSDDSASAAESESESESDSETETESSESESESESGSGSTGTPTFCDSLPCGKGDCVLDDAGVPSCACDAGWAGDLCDGCAPGHLPRSGYCMAAPNYAFVSKTKFDGAEPGTKGQSGFQYARDLCNAEAGAAGLPGAYVPLWLAAGNSQPYVFFGDARGWVRPDLRVVADQLDEFVFGVNEAAPVLHADGSAASSSPGQHAKVWLGSSPSFSSALSPACDNWTSNANDQYAGQTPVFEPISTQNWLVESCDNSLPVLCLGTDIAGQIPEPLPPSPNARIAFASGSVLVDVGLEEIDSRCQSDWAQHNPWDIRTFRAMVAANGRAPIDRVGLTEAQWVRPDGVELAPDLQTFTKLDWGGFFNRNANGSLITPRPIALGSSRLDEVSATGTCGDWTNREADGGDAIFGNSNLWPTTFANESTSCQQPGFVYFMCGEVRE